MSNPAQHRLRAGKGLAPGQGRSFNHDHRHAKHARGSQLGHRPAAARVLGHKMGNPMGAHQLGIARFGEGPPRHHQLHIGQGQGLRGWIDKAQHVGMLRLGSEVRQRLAADRQKDPRRSLWQGRDRGLGIGNAVPVVLRPGCPSRALQRNQRYGAGFAGKQGITADLHGKGMGCIHHMADPFGAQKLRQTLGAAKATQPLWQGLRARGLGPPGIGKYRFDPGLGQQAGQRAGLGGAAQKKDARHV